MSCGCNKNSKLKEALEVDDLEQIRYIIRREIAKIFFDLYRKRQVWEK